MWKGIHPHLGDLLTMVINHLRVMGWSSKYPFIRPSRGPHFTPIGLDCIGAHLVPWKDGESGSEFAICFFPRLFANLSWLGNKLKKDQNGDFIRQKDVKLPPSEPQFTMDAREIWDHDLVVTSYLYFRILRVIHPPVKMITPSGPIRPLSKQSFEKKKTTNCWYTPVN